MNEKLLNLFGMARRAGKLSIGFEAVKQSVVSQKADIVFAAQDLSIKTVKELRFVCDPREIKVYVLPWDQMTLSNAIGIKAGCVSLNDPGFAEKADTLTQISTGEEKPL